jgi:Ser-tRNA(Ala) deacylase AlaX
MLRNKNLVYCWKIPQSCEDTDVSRIILTKTAYDILNNKIKGVYIFPKEKKPSFTSKLVGQDTCFSKCLKMILADPTMIFKKGENLEDSFISESEAEDLMREDTESEDQLEPDIPDPNAKLR